MAVRHLRTAGHDIDVVIGGRRPAEAAATARDRGASVVKFDVGDAETGPAAAGPFDLVVSVVQDPDDNLLRAALRAGSAHLGIVRKADNVGRTMIAAADLAQRPALIMGHWQAGVTTFAALAAAQEFGRVERIELAAVFDRADPTGPMTADDSEAFFNRALLRRDGRWENVEPANDIRTVDRDGLPAFGAQPMGVLDVPALAASPVRRTSASTWGSETPSARSPAGRRPMRSTPTCGAGTSTTCRRHSARWSATREGRPI
ncbi:hypothetical protein [Planotetraspora kaengkrachanensis]|uniref:Uncharacterized protein n=1 Tax=Planotetraspora kaengkrachanensis TaxID=575193 RepID=A0A8J3PS12_9ACTN|nr:hypothetical protein [Planotetraspora kaengkrachanensis]GIG77756.1 hypothetical protein Pka01_08830 [Planotetraspora kaengkrachanensis]